MLKKFLFFQDEAIQKKINASFGKSVAISGETWKKLVENLCSFALDFKRSSEEKTKVFFSENLKLKENLELSGPIEATLYVSSDAKDTDFTVKVIDVYPDGKAYNLDETIQRCRYREGYEKPLAWMEKDKVYKLTLQPMNTSNLFPAGHRLRIEVSSSNFPRFDRNLNTGGNNYDEATGVVAHNAVHHSAKYPSQLKVTVVKKN